MVTAQFRNNALRQCTFPFSEIGNERRFPVCWQYGKTCPPIFLGEIGKNSIC